MKLKKIIPLLLITILAGCSKKNAEELTIISPTGAPAVAFYNYATNENYTTNGTPANILSGMTQNGNDIVVIDTLSGLNAIKDADAPYQILATITFGNFYLVGTGNDDDQTIDADDKIVLFGQNQTPDKLFKFLYPNFTNITYVTNVQESGKCLCSGKTTNGAEDADYVFVAEPILTNILTNQECNTYLKTTIIDIQQKYKEATQDKLLTQASIFVKKGIDAKLLEAFATNLQKDIHAGIENPDLIYQGISKLDQQEAAAKYGIGAQMAKNVMSLGNRLGLGFEYALDIKEDIDAFIALFGAEATLNEYYYEKEW